MILIKIKRRDNKPLTAVEKNRLNRRYFFTKIEFNEPCMVLCNDDDYKGFYTSKVIAIDNTNTHLTLGTENTIYYFTKEK